MLTGEADADEVGKALNVGFSDYIHKSNVESITPRVLLHYCAYHTDLAERSAASAHLLYSHRRGIPLLGHTIDFHLVEAEILDEEYVFADSWKTIVRVDAGERKTHSVTLQRTSSFVVESEEKTKKQYSTEQIITKLRQAEVELGRGLRCGSRQSKPWRRVS